MLLWPNKKQWNSWSLPSRYTTIGVLLGIVGIIVALVLHCRSTEQSKNIQSQLDSLFLERHSEELKNKYPGGYMLLSIDSSKNISKNEFIPSKRNFLEEYEIDWNKMEIDEITDASVKLKLPYILYKPQNTKIDECTQTIPRSPIGRSYPLKVDWPSNKQKLHIELIEDRGTVFAFAIGFKQE